MQVCLTAIYKPALMHGTQRMCNCLQVAEMGSGLFAGVAIDNLHLTVHRTAAIMAAVAAAMTGIWSVQYVIQYRRSQQTVYERLEHDAELADFSQTGEGEHTS